MKLQIGVSVNAASDMMLVKVLMTSSAAAFAAGILPKKALYCISHQRITQLKNILKITTTTEKENNNNNSNKHYILEIQTKFKKPKHNKYKKMENKNIFRYWNKMMNKKKKKKKQKR